jgi:ribosome maturation factor RimP
MPGWTSARVKEKILEFMLKDKVTALLEEALKEDPSLFLLDLSVSTAQHIQVTLDGDAGVSLYDCMKVSRAIEQGLDREETDFSIEVASAGATAPLQMPRQYIINI